MLCEKCKKRTATVFYNENLNGKMQSYSLCGECAARLREKGELQDVTSMVGSFADPFSELHDQFFSGFFGMPLHKPPQSHKKCPVCDATYPEILKSGRVGCATCYATFADELSPLIASVHGNGEHVGNVPSRQRARIERGKQLERLKKDLQEAIQKEEYERAVSLRDEIRVLESSSEKEGN